MLFARRKRYGSCFSGVPEPINVTDSPSLQSSFAIEMKATSAPRLYRCKPGSANSIFNRYALTKLDVSFHTTPNNNASMIISVSQWLAPFQLKDDGT